MKAKSEAENRSGFKPNMLPLAAFQLSFLVNGCRNSGDSIVNIFPVKFGVFGNRN